MIRLPLNPMPRISLKIWNEYFCYNEYVTPKFRDYMGQSLQYIIIIVGLIFALDISDSDIYDNSWALVVGINNYENAPALSYAVEDALAIKNMLINQYGFPRKNVFYLADDDATQQNIKKQMYNITNALLALSHKPS